jgi:hypothetical protein
MFRDHQTVAGRVKGDSQRRSGQASHSRARRNIPKRNPVRIRQGEESPIRTQIHAPEQAAAGLAGEGAEFTFGDPFQDGRLGR